MCPSFTLDRIVAVLSAALPERATVCGWSLGALLALRWAALVPWEHGMAAVVFDDFGCDLAANPSAALQHFIALQAHGDAAERVIVRELRKCYEEAPPHPLALAAGLQLLGATDLRHQLAAVQQSALVLHGGRDAITPPAAGAWLAHTLPVARLAMIPTAAHAPFISDPSAFVLQVVEFCDE
jgi:pimeloyl-ACP methyl ester carboxylesterase